ncbi:NAD kinase [Fervidibacillus halotolerans]|uniref:NAD kinase n=1 Tax=Fervidibacillus halotolerans TaxID=2980027 RepID=A0A9E8M269_9BACI|nr:NAD kinase [Fervidibacillus halotolerans]WAA13076.1 NAD kinase [Fervidibacillus halotolerans]
MNFTVISKGDDKSNELMNRLYDRLFAHGLTSDQEKPDIVISVGGDGTLLYAFQRYRHRLKTTAFVGVHTGHLGFYADWVPGEIEKLVHAIATMRIQVVEYPLLEVVIQFDRENKKQSFLALNEATVKTKEGTFVMDVEINGEHFERFRGDGLCISTPSGSTAYNKALGGAIIHPSLASIQIAEMASINNRVFRTIGSPLILPSHHYCDLKPVTGDEFLITIDYLSFEQKNVRSIRCQVAKEKIRFARYKPFPFWDRVKASFIGD